jgi:hypothetical protein
MNDKYGRKPSALLLNVPGAVFSLVTTQGCRFIKEQALWNLLLVAVLAGIGDVLSYHWFLASVVAAAIMTGVFALVLPSALQVGFHAGLSLMRTAFVWPVITRAMDVGNWARDTGALTHSRVVVNSVPPPAQQSTTGAVGMKAPSEKGP